MSERLVRCLVRARMGGSSHRAMKELRIWSSAGVKMSGRPPELVYWRSSHGEEHLSINPDAEEIGLPFIEYLTRGKGKDIKLEPYPRREYGELHGIAKCDDCGWRTASKNAQALARRHAGAHGHRAHGEIGCAYTYDYTYTYDGRGA